MSWDVAPDASASSPSTQPSIAAPSASAPQGPPLSAEAVRGVIRDKLPEIGACYEPELKKHPNLRGKLVARFMIDEEGKVASVDMSSSKLPNEKVVDCAGKVFETMVFPRPPAGMVLITYPIDLMPEVTTEWK